MPIELQCPSIDASTQNQVSGISLFSLLFRGRAPWERGRGAVVLGGADEGQILSVHTAGAVPEHEATHPGHNPKVQKISQQWRQNDNNGLDLECFIFYLETSFNSKQNVTFQTIPVIQQSTVQWFDDAHIMYSLNSLSSSAWYPHCACLFPEARKLNWSAGEARGDEFWCFAEKTVSTRGAGCHPILHFFPCCLTRCTGENRLHTSLCVCIFAWWI